MWFISVAPPRFARPATHETSLCDGPLSARSGRTPGLARGRAGRGPARRAELRVNPRGLPREFLIARRADPPPTLLEPPYTAPKGRLVGVRALLHACRE